MPGTLPLSLQTLLTYLKRRYGIFLFFFIGLCFCFFHTRRVQENRLQQTRKAEEFIEASYAADVDAILALFPDSLYERLLSDTVELVDSEEEIPEFVGDRLRTCMETIETLFGEGWKYSFEITNRYEYTGKDLKDLNDCYEMMGVGGARFRQAAILTAEVRITGVNGTEGGQTILVPLVKEQGSWGIGQQIGSAYHALAAEGAYDVYGNLLDGFSFSYESQENTEEVTEGFSE